MWGPVMVENSKAAWSFSQTPFGGFTVLLKVLHDFQLVKIINDLNRLSPSKV